VHDQSGVQRSKIDGVILFSAELAGGSNGSSFLRTFCQQFLAPNTKSENRR
jgi:hypothetical protein